MSAFWTEAAIIAALLAYLAYVSRPVSRYRMAMHCDAPLDIVWQVFHFRPERPDLWMKEMASVTWEDEARTTYRVTYTHGKVEALFRDIEIIPESLSVIEGAYLQPADGQLLDTCRSEARFEPREGGVLVTTDITFVRESLFAGLGMRISYPFLGFFLRGRMQESIRKQIAERGLQQSGTIRLEGWWHRLVERLGGWPFVLSVTAILWFVIDLGLWPGFVLVATILAHEGGHLWSMRRHGVPAKATLVPFFGGLAYGSKPMPSDASDAEMILMGPVFGLAFGGALFGIAHILPEPDFWLAASGMALIVNGLNLLPILPLDGGQVMPLLLRRFGQRAVTSVSLGMVAAGVGLAWWLSSVVMLVLIVVLGTMIAFSAPRGIARSPMSPAAAMTVLAAYLGLILAHAILVFAIIDALEFSDWFGPLASGPFGS